MKELIKCSGGMAGIAGDQASMLHWKRCTTQKPHWEGGREGGRDGGEVRVQKSKTSDCLLCLLQSTCVSLHSAKLLSDDWQ